MFSYRVSRQKFHYSFWYLLLFLLFGLNYEIADRSTYLRLYYATELSATQEPFFESLMHWSASIGVSYQSFVILLGLAEVLALHYAIRRYTKYEAQVLLLFLIYPFAYTVAQIRNTLSMLIILCAVKYLGSDKKGSTIKYILLTMIAALYHNTAIFYMIFLVIKVFNIKQLKRVVIALVFIGLMISRTDILVNMAAHFVQVDRYINWLSNRTRGGFVIYTVIVLTQFLLVHIAYKEISKQERQKNIKNNFEVLYKINLCLLLVIPLLSYGVLAYRLCRNLLPFSYALIIEAYHNGFKPPNKRLFLMASILFVFLLAVFMYSYTSNNFQWHLLRYNYLIDIFR